MKPTFDRRQTITRHFVSDRQFYGLCGATSLHDRNHALTEMRHAVTCSECRAIMQSIVKERSNEPVQRIARQS